MFATLECELFDQQPDGRSATGRGAELTVFDLHETSYDPSRRHSAFGHLSPREVEAQHVRVVGAEHAVATAA